MKSWNISIKPYLKCDIFCSMPRLLIIMIYFQFFQSLENRFSKIRIFLDSILPKVLICVSKIIYRIYKLFLIILNHYYNWTWSQNGRFIRFDQFHNQDAMKQTLTNCIGHKLIKEFLELQLRSIWNITIWLKCSVLCRCTVT